jgi:tRNA threonylcarbamoyladenosine biosynthesis protein TsaE
LETGGAMLHCEPMEIIKLENLGAFAEKIIKMLPEKKETAALITLQGDLGAGKTTFVQAFAKALGVTATVQSPTYVLMKNYDISKSSNSDFPFTKLVHIDAYRLEKPEQFSSLKPEQFLQDPKNIICIEWPERIEGMLPKADIVLHFSSENMQEGERGVEIEKLV